MSPAADTEARRSPGRGQTPCETGSGSSRPRARCSSSSDPRSRSTRSLAGPVSETRLYRHFADRDALIHEVVLFVLARTTERAQEAAAEEEDTFAALRRFTHAAADERIGALCPLLTGTFEQHFPDLTHEQVRLEEAVEGLFERAHKAGRLRADVAVGDLLVALSQLTRPLPGTACLNMDQFAHRHLQLFLDGLEAPARSELPGTAATLEDLRNTP